MHVVDPTTRAATVADAPLKHGSGAASPQIPIAYVLTEVFSSPSFITFSLSSSLGNSAETAAAFAVNIAVVSLFGALCALACALLIRRGDALVRRAYNDHRRRAAAVAQSASAAAVIGRARGGMGAFGRGRRDLWATVEGVAPLPVSQNGGQLGGPSPSSFSIPLGSSQRGRGQQPHHHQSGVGVAGGYSNPPSSNRFVVGGGGRGGRGGDSGIIGSHSHSAALPAFGGGATAGASGVFSRASSGGGRAVSLPSSPPLRFQSHPQSSQPPTTCVGRSGALLDLPPLGRSPLRSGACGEGEGDDGYSSPSPPPIRLTVAGGGVFGADGGRCDSAEGEASAANTNAIVNDRSSSRGVALVDDSLGTYEIKRCDSSGDDDERRNSASSSSSSSSAAESDAHRKTNNRIPSNRTAKKKIIVRAEAAERQQQPAAALFGATVSADEAFFGATCTPSTSEATGAAAVAAAVSSCAAEEGAWAGDEDKHILPAPLVSAPAADATEGVHVHVSERGSRTGRSPTASPNRTAAGGGGVGDGVVAAEKMAENGRGHIVSSAHIYTGEEDFSSQSAQHAAVVTATATAEASLSHQIGSQIVFRRVDSTCTAGSDSGANADAAAAGIGGVGTVPQTTDGGHRTPLRALPSFGGLPPTDVRRSDALNVNIPSSSAAAAAAAAGRGGGGGAGMASHHHSSNQHGDYQYQQHPQQPQPYACRTASGSLVGLDCAPHPHAAVARGACSGGAAVAFFPSVTLMSVGSQGLGLGQQQGFYEGSPKRESNYLGGVGEGCGAPPPEKNTKSGPSPKGGWRFLRLARALFAFVPLFGHIEGVPPSFIEDPSSHHSADESGDGRPSPRALMFADPISRFVLFVLAFAVTRGATALATALMGQRSIFSDPLFLLEMTTGGNKSNLLAAMTSAGIDPLLADATDDELPSVAFGAYRRLGDAEVFAALPTFLFYCLPLALLYTLVTIIEAALPSCSKGDAPPSSSRNAATGTGASSVIKREGCGGGGMTPMPRAPAAVSGGTATAAHSLRMLRTDSFPKSSCGLPRSPPREGPVAGGASTGAGHVRGSRRGSVVGFLFGGGGDGERSGRESAAPVRQDHASVGIGGISGGGGLRLGGANEIPYEEEDGAVNSGRWWGAGARQSGPTIDRSYSAGAGAAYRAASVRASAASSAAGGGGAAYPTRSSGVVCGNATGGVSVGVGSLRQSYALRSGGVAGHAHSPHGYNYNTHTTYVNPYSRTSSAAANGGAWAYFAGGVVSRAATPTATPAVTAAATPVGSPYHSRAASFTSLQRLHHNADAAGHPNPYPSPHTIGYGSGVHCQHSTPPPLPLPLSGGGAAVHCPSAAASVSTSFASCGGPSNSNNNTHVCGNAYNRDEVAIFNNATPPPFHSHHSHHNQNVCGASVPLLCSAAGGDKGGLSGSPYSNNLRRPSSGLELTTARGEGSPRGQQQQHRQSINKGSHHNSHPHSQQRPPSPPRSLVRRLLLGVTLCFAVTFWICVVATVALREKREAAEEEEEEEDDNVPLNGTLAHRTRLVSAASLHSPLSSSILYPPPFSSLSHSQPSVLLHGASVAAVTTTATANETASTYRAVWRMAAGDVLLEWWGFSASLINAVIAALALTVYFPRTLRRIPSMPRAVEAAVWGRIRNLCLVVISTFVLRAAFVCPFLYNELLRGFLGVREIEEGAGGGYGLAYAHVFLLGAEGGRGASSHFPQQALQWRAAAPYWYAALYLALEVVPAALMLVLLARRGAAAGAGMGMGVSGQGKGQGGATDVGSSAFSPMRSRKGSAITIV